jgi:importin subunit beta-1
VHKKEAALNTIGYICEEIAQLETTCLEARSNEILTAVVAGMRADEPDPKIKVAATKALCNALEFAKSNFDVSVRESLWTRAAADMALRLPPARDGRQAASTVRLWPLLCLYSSQILV